MNESSSLIDIIRALIAGAPQPITLSRGLVLRYRQPGQADRRHRLLVYRRGVAPSNREMAIVRRDLERVIHRSALPAESWEYGQLQGYLLPWLPVAQFPTAAASPYIGGA